MNLDISDSAPTLVPIPSTAPETYEGFDRASGGYSVTGLLHLLKDCEDQPDWRVRADLAAAYIDGKQFTPEQEAAARAEGLGNIRPTNLIARTIRSICGQEAKSRTDVRVFADEDEYAEVCDVANVRLKEAQRETYADMAVSQAYFGQVGPGLGWVEVARNADPLDYPYRVNEVHRSEMWWDWRAKDVILLRDARWIARKRWQDLDELEAAMPKHRELLRMVSNGWSSLSFDNTVDEQLVRQWDGSAQAESRWSQYQRRSEWFDSARKRVKLYEVWYKVPAYGVVMFLGPTKRVLYDPRNQAHVQAVASGRVRVAKVLTTQVRMALFAGPHRLQDIGTTRRNFPYVPFFAYRDDEDLSPYGLVEGMIAPQDEYNARRLRINWLLRARQILLDSDALDLAANKLEDIAAQIMRPDLTVVLNPNRTNKTQFAFQVLSNLALQKEQIEVMQDAKQLLQDVPGVYGAQLGQQASGVTSGIANSLLIEQGTVAMGDMNDNYRHSRRMVFENLLDLILEDHIAPNMAVRVGEGENRRVVVLNQWDPQANEMRNNMADAALRVGLGEVPSTPAFKMQQQQVLGQLIQALAQSAPQAAAIMAPSLIEATDLPDRKERADDVRRSLGIPTAQDKAAAQQAAEQQRQEQARQKQMADAAAQLELEDKAATVAQKRSVAQLNEAKTVEIGHGMGMANAGLSEQRDGRQAEAANDEDRLIAEALAEAQAAIAG